MRLRRGAVCAALALAAMTGACGGSEESPDSAQPAQLTGRHWVLDADTLVDGGGSVNSWIRFEDDGRVVGNDGCNQFAGSWRGDGSNLELGPLAGTQMACTGAAGEVAARVSQRLRVVTRAVVEGNTMELTARDGASMLGYHEGSESLDGAWKATSVLYDDAIRSVVLGTELTATFGADGRVSGSTGCNAFHGPFDTGGATLAIGPLTSTRKACTGPDEAQAQERGYLAALESVVRFELRGDRLTLFNAQGQMAVTLERSA